MQVREGPGERGLMLYHSDECVGPGFSKVAAVNLADELQHGNYRLAVVRRLRKRLTAEQTALVLEFTALNVGNIITEDQVPSSVLMASTGATPGAAFERFSCSEFVAMMLHLAGLVEPTDSPHEFVARDRKGRLVGPACLIKLRPASPTLSPRHSPFGSPTSTVGSSTHFRADTVGSSIESSVEPSPMEDSGEIVIAATMVKNSGGNASVWPHQQHSPLISAR